ncbi:MAG: hypothetical protein ACRDV3_12875 [Acidothermaceae bacterium]
MPTNDLPRETAEISALLDDPESWTGGYYELTFLLGPPDSARLQAAMNSLISAAGLLGPWRLSPDSERVRGTWTSAELDRGALRTAFRLPDNHLTAAVLLGPWDADGDDSLTLGLPLGALARVDKRIGAFPFGDDGGPRSLSWRQPLDSWLAEIAEHVRRSVGFELAVIGLETDVDDAESARLTSGTSTEHPAALLLADGSFIPATS